MTTSMSEVLARKAQIDQAICARNPSVFAAHLQAWLEATAFLRALPNLRKLGLEPDDIPAFEAADLRDVSIRKEADDAVMAFCVAAALAHDMAAFKSVDRHLTEYFGIIYPGSSALYHCNQLIDPIVTLDDAVGQVLKALLEQAPLTPPQLWNAGLRLLQRLRSSSFGAALTPLVAAWMRVEWAAVAQAATPCTAAEAVKACLADTHADQAFIAALLAAAAGLLDAPVEPEYLSQLAKLAERG